MPPLSFSHTCRVYLIALAAVAALGLALLARPVPVAATLCADNYTVTSTADDMSPSTLRFAIAAICPGGTITITANGTIPLSTTLGALGTNKDMTMVGPGRNSLAIDGGGAIGVFQINSGQLRLAGVTIQNGMAPSGGGIVVNAGSSLILTSTVLAHNTSSGGGALYNALAGTAVVSDVIVILNTETGSNGGGGIRNDGTMSLSNVTFQYNSTTGAGGGIANTGSLSTDSVIFSGNTAVNGGGIFSQGPLSATRTAILGNTGVSTAGGIFNGGPLSLINSTVISNTAGGSGGGIVNNAGNLSLANVTVSGNAATMLVAPARAPAAVGQIAGGIYSYNFGSVVLENVTLANNSAGQGGGIFNDLNFGSSIILSNTIVANNTGGNCLGHVTSSGHNLDSADSCLFRQSGDITNTNPLLAPLANNGGSGLTHALGTNSPAVNAGDPVACAAFPVNNVDQRGLGRRNGFCDMGAYEAQPGEMVASAGSGQSAIINHAFETPLQTLVKDAHNNPLGGVVVTFSGPGSGAGIAGGGTRTSNVNGLASFAATANAVIGGPYSVTASAGNLNAVFTLTNLPYAVFLPFTQK